MELVSEFGVEVIDERIQFIEKLGGIARTAAGLALHVQDQFPYSRDTYKLIDDKQKNEGIDIVGDLEEEEESIEGKFVKIEIGKIPPDARKIDQFLGRS